MAHDVMQQLVATVRARRTASADASYTRKLLDSGPQRCARKFGEEAVEFVVAASAGTAAEVTAEAADVLYHLVVALEARGVPFEDVLGALKARTAQSGLAEKASRGGAK
jgi:phosphoribosyl-ATP pyrophosphohydrolase